MGATQPAGESSLDFRRDPLMDFLRMAIASWGDRGEKHFDHWGGGPGGPRGAFSFGRFGGRGFGRGKKRQRVQHGEVRAAVLVLLDEQPMHGYQLIQEIEERSGGVWQPSPGSVYPVLQQLEDEGLVRIEHSSGRKVAHLTEAGRTYVEDKRAELEAAWNTGSANVDERVTEIRNLFPLIQQIAAAAKQLARVGTVRQLAEAKNLLNDTRRRLYLILAEEDASEEQDAGGAGRVT
jgi:DNA-binding PadR family transcriptional regulator